MKTPAWRAVAVAALALLVVACAPLAPSGPAAEALFADAAFAPPAQPIDPKDVFALSPAMRVYLEQHMVTVAHERGLQRGLIDSLYSKQQLALVYDAEFTRNAAEAFEAREGNCLSLAIMTAAFAKELGLAVRYRSVLVDDSWGRDGDLVQYLGHVNVSIGRHVALVRTMDSTPDWWTVDFLPPADVQRQRVVPIDEARVIAMYMNNKSAEALARQRTDEAYWWIRSAIGTDPAYADAYNTLGLVYLRHGLPARAEGALRAALERRSGHPQALNNLAIVLRRLHRDAEAEAVDEQLARMRAASPFSSFNRGLKAYQAGDYPRARDLFEQALARSNDYHEFHFWLADTYARLGQRERAEKHLRLAEENSNTRQQQTAYAAKLQRLKATMPGDSNSATRAQP
ncbi:MAG TPA: tetratricopeptide repeat protein [Ideonella sp.]|nr:tetratricopeptide repeat protein [Ideonella sp.]